MIHSCKMLFSFWMNISFNSTPGNQGGSCFAGRKGWPGARTPSPTANGAGFGFCPHADVPRPHGPHLCAPSLQAGGNVQRGKCKMQETAPAFIFTPGRARSPCAVFWGSTFCGFSGFKVLEKIIPEVKQHESRQDICPSPVFLIKSMSI